MENQESYGQLNILTLVDWAPPFWIFNEISKNWIHFIKVVLLINLVYFGGNDCLSLELNIYKNLQKNYSWKSFIISFCRFNLGCAISQSLKYGGIHDSHFEYIQTTVISSFLGQFWKILHQNKWLAKHFTPIHTYSLYCVPLKPIHTFNTSGYDQMGQVMRKRVLWHMRTTKAQISLCIFTVWSAPMLFAT